MGPGHIIVGLANNKVARSRGVGLSITIYFQMKEVIESSLLRNKLRTGRARVEEGEQISIVVASDFLRNLSKKTLAENILEALDAIPPAILIIHDGIHRSRAREQVL